MVADSVLAKTPPKANSAPEDFCFVIRKRPAEFIYQDEILDFDVILESTRGSQQSPPSDVEIVANLDERSTAKFRLEMLEPSRVSASRKVGRVQCRLVGCVPGDSFHIKVSAKDGRGINSCITSKITVVYAKLVVTTDPGWEDIWYKDEGGRDKCIEVYVSAITSNGMTYDESVTINAELYYEGESPVKVSNQDIMRLVGADRKLVVDRKNSKLKVRFRVEDVSKNHQGQEFVLKVSPAGKSGSVVKIAPAFSPPVSIRSKRNKRQRPSSASGNRSSTASADRGRSSPIRPQELLEPLYIDSNTCRDAIRGVTKWTEDVVNSLYPLQWQIIGYALKPDGSPDYGRPYHSMPDPTATINRVIARYNEDVREKLQILQGAIEQSSVTSSHEAPIPFSHADTGGYSIMPSNVPTPQVLVPRQYPEASYHNYPIQQSYYHHPAEVRMPLEKLDRRRLSSPLDESRMSLQQEVKRAFTDHSESKVEYVLARKYNSERSGDYLGFPAYTVNKEIVGFYQDIMSKTGVKTFIPIHKYSQEFGPFQIMQANEILEQAMAEKSREVYALKDWGSISRLLDQILVYDFSKDVDNAAGDHT